MIGVSIRGDTGTLFAQALSGEDAGCIPSSGTEASTRGYAGTNLLTLRLRPVGAKMFGYSD